MEGLIERELGGYRVIRELGRGSMGVVYHAVQTTLERDVALKVLAPNLVSDRELVQRFLREARLAAKLNHPHIVHIYDQGVEQDLFYIAMEYVPGSNLRQLLDAKVKLLPQTAVEIAMAVCEALQFAHENGVIHRDVKPDNVMMNEGGGPLKIADFGLAKGVTSHTLTVPGALIGSPHYMALEQLRGEEIDARADVYSLGRMLYRMLAGRAPFESADLVSLIVHEINDEPPTLREFAPEVSLELEAIVMKAQSRFKEDRYQSARAMLVALRSLKGMPVPAPSSGTPVQSELRRRLIAASQGSSPSSISPLPVPSFPRPASTVGADLPAFPRQAAASPKPVDETRASSESVLRFWATLSYFGPLAIVALLFRREETVRYHAKHALALHLLRLLVIGLALGIEGMLRPVDVVFLIGVGIPFSDHRFLSGGPLLIAIGTVLFWLVAAFEAFRAWRTPYFELHGSRGSRAARESAQHEEEEQERQYWEQLHNERRQRYQEALIAAERERLRREQLRSIGERIDQILAKVVEINDRFTIGDIDRERYRDLKQRFNEELDSLKEAAKSLEGSFPGKEARWLPD